MKHYRKKRLLGYRAFNDLLAHRRRLRARIGIALAACLSVGLVLAVLE